MQRLRHGAVYAIGTKVLGPIKVGSASDVLARRADLQAGSFQPLLVLGAKYCGTRATANKVESLMHRKFSDRRIVLDGAREWFNICLWDFDNAAREIFCG